MPEKDRFAEIKRCLALADRAFARARACEDEHERAALIDEAEARLLAAERAFGRLTDRMGMGQPRRPSLHEARSFAERPGGEPGADEPGLLWRPSPAPRR
jgi:hypothetical protein